MFNFFCAKLNTNSSYWLNRKISHFICCNTIAHEDLVKEKWVTQLSVAPLIGEAIKRIHNEDSVSFLFDDLDKIQTIGG